MTLYEKYKLQIQEQDQVKKPANFSLTTENVYRDIPSKNYPRATFQKHTIQRGVWGIKTYLYYTVSCMQASFWWMETSTYDTIVPILLMAEFKLWHLYVFLNPHIRQVRTVLD